MIRVCSCRVLKKTLTILGEKLKPSEYNVNSWFRIKIFNVNCPAVFLLTLDNTNPMKFYAYCPTPIWSRSALTIFLAIIKQILNSMFSLPNVSYIVSRAWKWRVVRALCWKPWTRAHLSKPSFLLWTERAASSPQSDILLVNLFRLACLVALTKISTRLLHRKIGAWSLCRTGCHLLQQVSRPEQSNPDLGPRVGSHVR